MALGPIEWFIVLVVLLGTAVWIWALVDCLLHEPNQGNAKLIWIIVIVFTHVVGAILYLLIRRSRWMATSSP
jgi:hypothetical protein